MSTNPLPTAGAARAASAMTAPAASAPRGAVANAPQKTLVQIFYEKLLLRKKSWADTLPKHVPVDRFIKSVMISVTKNPKVMQCTDASVFQCLNTAANLGLDLSGNLNASHLIPFKDTCTLVIGYRDLIGLARRSGQIATINTFAIHEGDRVVVHYGTSPKIEHEPKWSEPGKFLGVYATATLVGGEFVFTPIMARAEVDRIRDNSQGYKAAIQYGKPSPWTDHYEEMAKKTALRRLFKILPVATEEVSRALEASDRSDAGLPPAPPIEREGMLDVEGMSRAIEDATAASDAEGAPGAVDEALKSAEAAQNGGVA